jgi:pyridinium-3,5-biscarboxylic acid mononucleotide sulfurtransferase
MDLNHDKDAELRAKLDSLRGTLASLGSVMVAYSGGTDSAYLAYVAHQLLGERMLAVIADSPSLPRKELSDALAFVAEWGIPVHILQTQELDNPEYARNDRNRCFHCKDELFTQMEAARNELGFAYLAYGRNLDDDGDFRPGQKAAVMHHAVAPLAMAELRKLEIRTLARAAGLALADKPASACLSSRIEYGRPVTVETLGQVERAEAALHAMGFAQVRVRHHGELARIEIERSELPRALTVDMLDRITTAVKVAGYVYVTLDAQGYRSGSMNDVIPVSAIAAAG